MNRTVRDGTSFQKIGALCAGVAPVLARGVALVLAASLATGLVPHRALAAPGDITTVAGGLGQGPGLNIAQTPSAVAVKGTLVYVADYSNSVVRRLDTTSGDETVVAGNGSAGFSGDGGRATAAQLNGLGGVALDDAGDLFIGDYISNRIRRVDAVSGVVTTVAGNGSFGFSGDGGPATAAQLNNPGGLALDGAGSLFIADQGNNRIRRVDAVSGVITTVAGIGGFGGGFSGDGGLATAAGLNGPGGVALDGAGDLFIADFNNARIRRVDAVSGVITTVAGNGGYGFSGDGSLATAAQLSGPVGVALDGAGDLFIAGNNRIRRVDAVSGVITTVAGNGGYGFSGDGSLATAAQFYGLGGVALDGVGDLFIADGSNRIRRVDAASGVITTVAGNGSARFSGDGALATAAQFNDPAGVALDGAGDLFIADFSNSRIRRVDAVSGVITTVAGNGSAGFSGDSGPATTAQLDGPFGVALDGAGDLFIAEYNSQRIRRVDAVSGVITTVAGNGSAGFSGDGGLATAAQLYIPYGVALDGAGDLFIADFGNSRIRRVDAVSGVITTVAGNGSFDGFPGDGGLATAAELNGPAGVALDGAGDLFIADRNNNRIRRVDAVSGVITTVAGNGGYGFSGDGGLATAAQLGLPNGVALDGAGDLFIVGDYTQRIRRVDAVSGVITTVAGNGSANFSGDGGPATAAELDYPSGVALDGAGDLFIADAGNNRIRKVQGGGSTTTTVTTTTVPSTTTTFPFVRIQATSLTLKDDTLPPINPTARKFSFKSSTRKDAPGNRIVLPAFSGSGDPTIVGATLVVYDSGGLTSDAVTVSLPPTSPDGSAWTRLGTPTSPQGYRYKGKNPNGPVARVTVRADSISIRGGKASWSYTLNEAAQGRVAVRLRLGSGAGWCADAPAKTSGTPPSTATDDTVDRFIGQPKTPAPGVCPSLP